MRRTAFAAVVSIEMLMRGWVAASPAYGADWGSAPSKGSRTFSSFFAPPLAAVTGANGDAS